MRTYSLYTENTGATSIVADDGGGLLWTGPLTRAYGGGHTDKVNIDFARMEIWARVRVSKLVGPDEDGFTGLLYKDIVDKIDLTPETVARYGMEFMYADNGETVIGLTWK